jgi:hypothetical protein
MIQPRFPDVTVRVIGLDYNRWDIQHRVKKALKDAGHEEHVNEFERECGNAPNDIRMILTVQEWVDIT